MPKPQLFSPTTTGDVGDVARQLSQLLGPAYQAPQSSLVAADLLALASAIVDARATIAQALDEALASTVDDLLAETEASYGLPSRADLTTAERRTRLLAKIRALREATPDAIDAALTTLASGAVTVHKATSAETTAAGAAGRYVHQLGVVIPVDDFNDADVYAAMAAIVEQMKPAFMRAWIGTRVGFLCDDPNSLTDRDLL